MAELYLTASGSGIVHPGSLSWITGTHDTEPWLMLLATVTSQEPYPILYYALGLNDISCSALMSGVLE